MRTYKSMEEAFYANLYYLLSEGTPSPDGGREHLHGHTFAISDPTANYVVTSNPHINNNIEYLEAFWDFVMDPECDTARLCELNPKAKNFLAEHNGRNIAYGPRIEQQIVHVLTELTEDPASRRASIMILEGADQELATAKRSENAKVEYPCTIAIQYYVRDGKLHAHTVMRSNCYVTVVHIDVYVQTRLQKMIADALGLELGTYIHTALNAHILGGSMERAKKTLEHVHETNKG